MRVRLRWAMAVAVAGVLVLGSCGSDGVDPAEGDSRTAAVYVSILEWMLDEELPAGAEDVPEWELFVASRSEEAIDIDAQVGVIEALESTVVVRFIDERSEAIEEVDGSPVRDEGVLVGLGAVAPEGDTVEVYVDRYRDVAEVEAWAFTLRLDGGSWQVVGAPAGTDVRPLPDPD